MRYRRKKFTFAISSPDEFLYLNVLTSTLKSRDLTAGIATLVRRVDQPSVTVGMDGSFFRFHPEFERSLKTTIDELLDNKYKASFYTRYQLSLP